MNSLNVQPVLIYCLIGLNILAFVVYGLDKWKATHQQWRIPEATLLLLALIGGSLGAWLGMKAWHHKTLKPRFRYGVPLILLVQLALLSFCSCRSARGKVVENRTYKTPEMPIKSQPVGDYSPTTLIVMYDSLVGKKPLMQAIRKYGAEVIYDYKIITGMAIRKPENKTLEESITLFRKVKGVLSVERDHIIHLTDPVRPKTLER